MGSVQVGEQSMDLGRLSSVSEGEKEWLKINTGYEFEELKADYKKRFAVNVKSAQRLAEQLTLNPPVFIQKQTRLW